MNRIELTLEGVPEPRWIPKVSEFCLTVLKELSLDNRELSIVFCNNDFIRELNHRFRGKDEPTDVLTFSQEEGDDEFPGAEEDLLIAGDIVISLEMLDETKLAFKVEPEEEIKRLLIHGILHLAGYDHSDNSPEQPMLKIQEDLVGKFSEDRLF